MTSYHWCSTCKILFTNDTRHESHDVTVLGTDRNDTVASLDQIIEYGLENLQTMEGQVDNARHVQRDISNMKEKFTQNLRKRIESIVKDLRVALEDHAMLLMGDVDKQAATMELNVQEIIKKSTVKIDTAKQFIQKVAVVLPDETGNFDQTQLDDVFNFYQSLQKVTSTPVPEVKPVLVHIKFPNTMKTKTECKNLAQRVIGEIENNERSNLLNSRRPSIDVVNVQDFSLKNLSMSTIREA